MAEALRYCRKLKFSIKLCLSSSCLFCVCFYLAVSLYKLQLTGWKRSLRISPRFFIGGFSSNTKKVHLYFNHTYKSKTLLCKALLWLFLCNTAFEWKNKSIEVFSVYLEDNLELNPDLFKKEQVPG